MRKSLKIRPASKSASDNKRVQVLGKAPKLNSWTLCLLIGSFVPIPRVTSVTCEQPGPIVKSAYNQPPAKHLPQSWIVGRKDRALHVERACKTGTLSVRVMDRLRQAIAHEPNPWYADDYRLAWHIVDICMTGEAVICSPAVLAWYKGLGCHPDHVWPRICANDQAQLGTSSARTLGGSEPTGAAAIPDARTPSKPSAPVLSIKKKEATA